MEDCENKNCDRLATHRLQIVVGKGGKDAWPRRSLCDRCAGATVASGRVVTCYNLYRNGVANRKMVKRVLA